MTAHVECVAVLEPRGQLTGEPAARGARAGS